MKHAICDSRLEAGSRLVSWHDTLEDAMAEAWRLCRLVKYHHYYVISEAGIAQYGS